MIVSMNNDEITKLMYTCWSWMRLIIIIIHNAYCIPIYLLINWIILLPLYHLNYRLYNRIENCLYNYLLYVVGSWSFGAGIHIVECGDDIYKLNDAKLLIVANHQSTGDVPIMMQSLQSRSKYILLWIMDKAFKFTNFGFVSVTHGDYFLNTKGYKNGHILDHCLKRDNQMKNAIILFPEGGFRHKRLQSSNRFAVKNNLPSLYHVTWPRFGAFHEVMSPSVGITHIVDLTIMYEDLQNPVGIMDIGRGNRKSCVVFYYRVYDVNKEQISEQWLNDRWIEKDKILEQYYRDRSALLSKSTKTHVTMNWFKIVSIHCLYIFVWFTLFSIYKHF